MKSKGLMITVTVSVMLICMAAIIIFTQKTQPLGDVTIVSAPMQNEAITPEWAAVDEFIAEDFGDNLALNKNAESNGHVGPYTARNAIDGDVMTYWEGAQDAYPNELTVDLGEQMSVSKVRILLNPDTIWGQRTQGIEVQGSGDGDNYETLSPYTEIAFDPVSGGNQAVIYIEGIHQVRYVRLVFTSNTEARAGQAAEVQIYG